MLLNEFRRRRISDSCTDSPPSKTHRVPQPSLTYGCCFQPTSSSRSPAGRRCGRRLAACPGRFRWMPGVDRAGLGERGFLSVPQESVLLPWACGWVAAESRIWLLSQDEQSGVLPCDSESAGLFALRLCLSLPSPSNPSHISCQKSPPAAQAPCQRR